ncbi:hypothetical protein [Streptomyces cinereoruber]|uniref:hypothetical protein n=1 Tax=Streptomyces cinereoruber TaxID=67260 RepID=UPI00363459BB
MFTAHYADPFGRPDDAGLRRRPAARLETLRGPRRERCRRLFAVVNGWSAPGSPAPVFGWSVEALRARVRR